MDKKSRFKTASQQELNLYFLVGESVCAIQYVENALSHSIVLKKAKLKVKAVLLLEKYRSYTRGRAVNIVEKDDSCPESFQNKLKEFLLERNWLIHKSIAHERFFIKAAIDIIG